MASSTSNTPNRNLLTPLRLSKRKHQVPSETPECYTRVTVETPGPPKIKYNKDKCDEIRNLAVAVRIRPMNIRELNCSSSNVVRVKGKNVIITASQGSTNLTKVDYEFPYDHVFWSCKRGSTNYATQENVFLEIGQPLLENAFQGYNACLFAYGQTGSGKSYSMMGPDVKNIDCDTNPGIIPRFSKELFSRISQLDSHCTASVNVSYFEIYNEKIHDLLVRSSKDVHAPLKVREHPDWGPYVVNLSTHIVKSYEEIRKWILLGNENRATAATAMNEKSSRSHSIFSVELSILEGKNDEDPGRRSKVSLVDLAGSERLGNIHKNEKIKEGVSINKSLLTLSKVICALADQKKSGQFVPYRESVLTWLLRESLGGNSLTCMLATITPSSTHLDETIATLRYACQARSIVNRARINEEPHDRLIRELRSEVERLTALRHEYERNSFSSSGHLTFHSDDYLQELEELRMKLNVKEEELQEAQRSWENRYKESHLYQMQQLAEIEKKKDELESQVRVMSNLNEEMDISPYTTNFLEEVENLLTDSNTNVVDYLDFRNYLQELGLEYKIFTKNNDSVLCILDSKNSRKANCSISELKSLSKTEDIQLFIRNLKWDTLNGELSESQIHLAMNGIYQSADYLKPYTEKQEKLRLAFAKFIKAAQVLETALCNEINVNKQKKIVTFKL